MCGIYGIINYGGQHIDMKELTELLGIYSSVRGEDATGISYVQDGKIIISKSPVSAYDFKFEVPDGIRAVMGHTRAATTGNKNDNYNNHPFPGFEGSKYAFALAHNGVISNVSELRTRYQITENKVKTDSYIAVQLVEHCGVFDMKSLKFMAENVRGMFTFTLHDNANNMYFVKGDSPLFILHFKRLGLYAYASTTRILFGALIDSSIGEEIYGQFRDGFSDEVVLIEPEEGDIVKIDSAGNVSIEKFEHTRYSYTKTKNTYKNYEYDDWCGGGYYARESYYGGRCATPGASTDAGKSGKDSVAKTGGSAGGVTAKDSGSKGKTDVDATKQDAGTALPPSRVSAEITGAGTGDKPAIPPATIPPGPTIKPANIPPPTQTTLNDNDEPTDAEYEKMTPAERRAWHKEHPDGGYSRKKLEEGRKAIGAFAGEKISDIALRESQ